MTATSTTAGSSHRDKRPHPARPGAACASSRARSALVIVAWLAAALWGAVNAGAAGTAASPGSHWAFEPPRSVAPPAVKHRRWVQSPIDAFVLARLETAGLTPVRPADKATLLRRITFDLIGLPPAPKEIDTFLNDTSPDALSRVVDRLLASPHYGERWGRHWLDVARYADSNGQDENKAMSQAWRYRDHVISAFNRDQPFDQFIREQLAGDLLPAANERDAFEQLVATGFLVLGPKMLAEQDKPKLVMDVIDEQIDVVSRAFLGLTVSCSRCHDHKFDPIPTRDYYALAGIFKSTKTMGDLAFVSKWNERSIATREERALFDDYVKRTNALERAAADTTREAETAVRALWRTQALDYWRAGNECLTNRERTVDSNHVAAVARKMNLHRGTVDRWARHLASTSTNGVPPTESSPIVDTNALLAIVGESPESATESERTEQRQDTLRQLLFGPDGLLIPPKNSRAYYPVELRQRLEEIDQDRAALRSNAPPALAMTLAVEESSPTNLPVYVRGSHLQPGPIPVPRGFVQVLNRTPSPEVPANQSGRLQLADWLTDPKHPLTARVTVNRIWQAHFGQGLVRTPDNFGLRGEAPTHPELLDWLALEFIRSGWSMKQLHRTIVLSSTYQMSSAYDARAAAADPDNRLLWRMNRRRLDAEPLRDALLAIAARLDLQMGGALVSWANAEYVPADTVSSNSSRRAIYLPVVRDRVYDLFTIFDFANPSVGVCQRTPTVVSHQALFFLNSPLVKEQSKHFARLLLVDPDVSEKDRVNRAYQRALGRPASRTEITRALAFLERARLTLSGSVKEEMVSESAWASLCQALLASNEFLYLD